MKRSRIVLFLFGVIAALAILCAVFPEEGVLGLRFPQLGEILSAAEPGDAGPSPEELMEQRRQAVLAAQGNEYQTFFREDPARFYLPGGDVRFFDELFAAFDRAETEPLRIVHYGDSQIEEDRITGTIRERLQERFGGNGPGMMPARKHATPRVGGGSTAELRRYFNYGDASHRAGIRQYGPYADFTRLDTVATFSFYPVSRKDKGQNTFERMTLVAGNVRSTLSVTSKGDKRTVEPGSGALAFIRYELPDSSTRASLTASGYADLYGILLDSKTGVRMDNIAMRGSSGAIFTTMDPEQLRSFYKEENVRLILLQYGGNSVPYLKTDKAISTYQESIRKQIKFLQGVAPKAKIVFVGPSDMATVVNGKRQTYPKLPEIVDSLRLAATESGAAYWDIYGVMGGENSMIQWVKARPALAGSDYVHFTLAGSQKVGDVFCDALLLYYEYYKWRKKNGR
jgi:lysophospholipase L1-like esterase